MLPEFFFLILLLKLFFLSSILDSYFTLWEWNLDVVLVQRIVDALHDGGVVHGLGKHIDPYHNLKGDAAVVETLEQYLYALFLIDALELLQFRDENLLHLLDVTSVCHAYFQRIQLITMVLGHVLVVLGEQLRVLEGDD